MANWSGASRTNYFVVASIEDFKRNMEAYDVRVIEQVVDGVHQVGVVADSDDGDWPRQLQLTEDTADLGETLYDEFEGRRQETDSVIAAISENAEEEGLTLTTWEEFDLAMYVQADDPDFVDISFPEIVSRHLIDGEVAVFITAGSERSRYVSGYACAMSNSREQVQVSLEDIYDLAKAKFGKEPTRAER